MIDKAFPESVILPAINAMFDQILLEYNTDYCQVSTSDASANLTLLLNHPVSTDEVNWNMWLLTDEKRIRVQ